MKISTKGRYGLRIMTDIAIHEKEGCVSIKDIATREGLSEKYLEQIITTLSKAGLVRSVRGARGGYLLSKSTKEISVEEILIATEGSLAPVACAEDNECCENYCDCVTSFIWTKIYDAIIGVVSNISLEELAERSEKCGGCKSC